MLKGPRLLVMHYMQCIFCGRSSLGVLVVSPQLCHCFKLHFWCKSDELISKFDICTIQPQLQNCVNFFMALMEKSCMKKAKIDRAIFKIIFVRNSLHLHSTYFAFVSCIKRRQLILEAFEYLSPCDINMCHIFTLLNSYRRLTLICVTFSPRATLAIYSLHCYVTQFWESFASI